MAGRYWLSHGDRLKKAWCSAAGIKKLTRMSGESSLHHVPSLNIPVAGHGMFHCEIDTDYIVLHDFEARSLFYEATGNARDALTYNMRMIGSGSRKRLQHNYRVISDHLRQKKREDPDLFHKSYVFRSHWGPEAVTSLFALMDGHRRLAPYADCAELDEFDAIAVSPATILDYQLPEFVTILLHSVCGLWRKRRTLMAEYQLLVRDLDHVFGTTKEFVVMTRHQKLKFTLNGLVVEARIIQPNREGQQSSSSSESET